MSSVKPFLLTMPKRYNQSSDTQIHSEHKPLPPDTVQMFEPSQSSQYDSAAPAEFASLSFYILIKLQIGAQ